MLVAGVVPEGVLLVAGAVMGEVLVEAASAVPLVGKEELSAGAFDSPSLFLRRFEDEGPAVPVS